MLDATSAAVALHGGAILTKYPDSDSLCDGASAMRNTFLLRVLTLALVLGAPACEASSLGLTVHVVPLEADGGNTVHAHFSAIAAGACPSLSGLCGAGEDCLVHQTSDPFVGTKPGSGWCVRQWQKTVPSDYNDTISLGPNTEMYVSLNAAPTIRENNGKLNQPPYVGLPPPLRARVGCSHHFQLSVMDLDGDRVTCRFAQADKGECVNCPQHAFIELNEEKCLLSFTGAAAAGQYFIYLMAEDRIPAPPSSQATDSGPLSAVPVHLSVTVESSTGSCLDEPVVSGKTPEQDATLYVLPYEEVQFDTDFESQVENVLEVGVVGPPGLFRVGFKSISYLATMTIAWVRSENQLPRLLPVCFAANSKSLQSGLRCVWLYQRETKDLPVGTVLTCDKTQMTLVLPVATLSAIDLSELQLNSPTCPVSYNSTHLTASIPLDGCGTIIVHSGSELVYTNTLHSVHPFTKVSRRPSMELPLACRFPAIKVGGPHVNISMPSEQETFGNFRIWVEVHKPGEGPMGNHTRVPTFRPLRMAQRRLRREAESVSSNAVGSRYSYLDLQVMSNCSIGRAKMIVRNCIESETADFAISSPILDQGCSASNTTLEVTTTRNNSKVYRLDLSNIKAQGLTMFVECTVNLCIATMPSQTCPDLCSGAAGNRNVVNSVFTNSYKVHSGPVSLVVTPTVATTTTAPPTTGNSTAAATSAAAAAASAAAAAASAAAANAAAAAAATFNCTSSHAPERVAASSTAAVISTFIVISLQNFPH
ncbi:uncharacterized protein LOC130192463 isoform X2 [Pseudoliparis swirei]|uniref:uncharacterized protein LOC130192463 isoform X2 n=1 Tax=Pseudoliparis swirei TaxID=2059687 RepID=UPI0024BE674D|nr:uncharacterized protein LOC130192463 isoform X2 [Pseudoliparis swirei]